MMKIKNIEKFPLSLRPIKVGYRKEDKSSSVWASGVPSIVVRVDLMKEFQDWGKLLL